MRLPLMAFSYGQGHIFYDTYHWSLPASLQQLWPTLYHAHVPNKDSLLCLYTSTASYGLQWGTQWSFMSFWMIYMLNIDPRSVIMNSVEIFLMHHSKHKAKVCENILNNRFHFRKEVNIQWTCTNHRNTTWKWCFTSKQTVDLTCTANRHLHHQHDMQQHRCIFTQCH